MSVCLNHPDREATHRCTACHKPICDECAISENEHIYCSVECQAGAKLTSEGVDHYQTTEAANKRKKQLIKIVIFLIILAAICAGAYFFLTQTEQGQKLKDQAIEKGKALQSKQAK